MTRKFLFLLGFILVFAPLYSQRRMDEFQKKTIENSIQAINLVDNGNFQLFKEMGSHIVRYRTVIKNDAFLVQYITGHWPVSEPEKSTDLLSKLSESSVNSKYNVQKMRSDKIKPGELCLYLYPTKAYLEVNYVLIQVNVKGHENRTSWLLFGYNEEKELVKFRASEGVE